MSGLAAGEKRKQANLLSCKMDSRRCSGISCDVTGSSSDVTATLCDVRVGSSNVRKFHAM